MEAKETKLCGPSFPLFVPADRPDLFARACQSGTDAIIIDFEDWVPPESKAAVRRIPPNALPAERQVAVLLRLNGIGTPWHRDDLAFAKQAGFDGVLLPKSESGAEIAALRASLGPDQRILAIIETVAGLARATEIAAQADRLIFGSLDLCQDLGCAHDQMVMLPLRSQIVQAARLAQAPAPLDGISVTVEDGEVIAAEARHASEMGFGGKCLIHPQQLAPTRAGFFAERQDLDWTRSVARVEADLAPPSDSLPDRSQSPAALRARRYLARETPIAKDL